MAARGNVPLALAGLALIIAACSPAPGASSRSDAAPPPTAPKVLTIAQEFEPPDIEGFGSLVRPAGSGRLTEVVHNHLTRKVREGVFDAELAAELPSIERGTWKVSPDGSMDLTWRIRSGVRWHDGTSFTSADLVFALDVYKHPALPPTASAGTFRVIESASAPDDQTLVLHWTQIDATAAQATGFTPLPRHLMADVFAADKEAFMNSSRFRNEFVGLGPYRLGTWELGSHMELTRFDDYYGGRPPLDTVIIRFIQDGNTVMANMLSGAVDVVLRPQIDLSTALDLKQRWEGLGNQSWVEPSGRVHYGEAQRRAELARPRNGLTDHRVRQAFLLATDRQALSDAFTEGYAPLADSYVAPDDPLRPVVESAITRYPYDLLAAARLLEEAGWRRGADGVLVHRDTGDVFESDVWAAPESTQKQEPQVLADQWGKLGARLGTYTIPVARINDRELAASSPTFTVTNSQAPETWFTPDRLHSRNIAAPQNNWIGRNKFGTNNPRLDGLLERLQVTVDPAARVDLHRQLLTEETADLTFFPFYWEVVPVFLAKGVVPSAHRPVSLANFVAWNRA